MDKIVVKYTPEQIKIPASEEMRPSHWREIKDRIAAEQNHHVVQPWHLKEVRSRLVAEQEQLPKHHWHWREIARRRRELMANTPPKLLYFRRKQKQDTSEYTTSKYTIAEPKIAKCRPIKL